MSKCGLLGERRTHQDHPGMRENKVCAGRQQLTRKSVDLNGGTHRRQR